VNQTNHFFNLGYGWLCKHCSAADAERRQHELHHHTRFLRHEAHQENQFPSPALARWTSPERQALNCPRCGVEERIKTS
jgi:hypothetical protein